MDAVEAADTAALALAGFAVFVGASTVVVLVARPLSRRRNEPEIEAETGTETGSVESAPPPVVDPDAPPVISIAVRADEDDNHRWRVTVPPDGHRVTVDVFSFRSESDGPDAPWRHELLHAPLRLAPGQTSSVGGPIDPDDAYAVSIAWVTHRAEGDSQTSELVHIRPDAG